MSEWPLHSFLELASLRTAVPCARLHAKHVIWEWGLEKLGDDTELITSELVTNALQATVAVERNSRSKQPAAVPFVELRLFSDKDQVLIEVWDGNPYPPKLQGIRANGIPALSEESGRGLFLVETLSREWGHYRTPAVEQPEAMAKPEEWWRASKISRSRSSLMMGKVVWALLA
jgi:anti-sigma regulatory factor (Ser/Thr protein kinase)